MKNSNPTGKLYNDSAENSVIGGLLINHKETLPFLSEIQEEYFFSDTNKKIFKAIKKLSEKGESVDMVTVTREANLKASFITQKAREYTSVTSFKTHLGYLKDYADARWFHQNLNEFREQISAKKASSLMSELSGKIIKRVRDNDQENPEVQDIIGEFEQYQDINRKHIESGAKYIGIPSGYEGIDNLISGIRGQHYWVVTAYTNTGKSYFLLNIVNNVLCHGKRVLFFSLEMSRVQNIARLLGIKTKTDPTLIEQGTSNIDVETKAKAELYDQKLTLYNQKKNIEDILIAIYAEHSKEPVDLIVLDYIQKVQSIEPLKRYDRFTMASDQIQKICQELNIPAIVASQIDNDSAKSENTNVISTKGSGDIASDADLALRLSKDKDDPKNVDCLIQKNRHGQKGGTKLRFGDGGALYEDNI